MVNRRFFIAATAVLLTIAAPPMLAQEPMADPAMREVPAADVTFEAIEVPGFASGMKIAPIHGDPSVADEPYTLRLEFPDGYRFPPHYHPRAENVTVLEGTFRLGMGETFDESTLTTYEPGSFLFIAAENPHFGQVSGRTVLQLHGVGPFEITVVEGQGMSP